MLTTMFLMMLLEQIAHTNSSTDAGKMPELLRQVERSGRVTSLIRELDEGVHIAPGAPPLLAFRYIEGRERGRFGGLDLVLDDAGH